MPSANVITEIKTHSAGDSVTVRIPRNERSSTDMPHLLQWRRKRGGGGGGGGGAGGATAPPPPQLLKVGGGGPCPPTFTPAILQIKCVICNELH